MFDLGEDAPFAKVSSREKREREGEPRRELELMTSLPSFSPCRMFEDEIDYLPIRPNPLNPPPTAQTTATLPHINIPPILEIASQPTQVLVDGEKTEGFQRLSPRRARRSE